MAVRKIINFYNNEDKSRSHIYFVTMTKSKFADRSSYMKYAYINHKLVEPPQ